MKYLPIAFAASCMFAALAIAADVASAQTSYFRLDNGLAAADGKPLPGELDDEHLVWKEPLPQGHSTPTIVGERIFLTGHDAAELTTICLDRASGRLLWKHSIHVEQMEKVHGEGSPAASTPACDGKRVYSFFGSFGLLCFDVDGKPLWSKRMGPFRDEFGSSSSPILVDDKVILCEDHDLDSFLIAVRQDNGETAWQTARDRRAAIRRPWSGRPAERNKSWCRGRCKW